MDENAEYFLPITLRNIASFANLCSLINLANKLVTDGPYKCEPTPRRVRGLFNGTFIFDTVDAYFVWEHPHYPQYASSLVSFYPPCSRKR